VYALGAIGYFLLTGREVFTGRSLVEVCSKHLSESPEPPSAVLGSTIEPALEALILRCLEKEPKSRPPDGAALARELERLDLTGWTLDDARRWWRELPGRREGTAQERPTEADRTQLEIDVEQRR
jgi:serine/threonine protein kinase